MFNLGVWYGVENLFLIAIKYFVSMLKKIILKIIMLLISSKKLWGFWKNPIEM